MIVSDAKTVAAELKVVLLRIELDIKFRVAATWQGRELRFSLSVLACAFDHCLPELPVIRNVRFEPHARRKRSVQGDSFCQLLESIVVKGLPLYLFVFEVAYDLEKSLR